MDLLAEDVLTNWVFMVAVTEQTVKFAQMITVTISSIPKKDCLV